MAPTISAIDLRMDDLRTPRRPDPARAAHRGRARDPESRDRYLGLRGASSSNRRARRSPDLRHLLLGTQTEKTRDVLARARSSPTARQRRRRRRRPPTDRRAGVRRVDAGMAGTPPRRTAAPRTSPCRTRTCITVIGARSASRAKSTRSASPGVLIRLRGQPPISGTVYELEKLRCNLCGELFTADPPPGVGSGEVRSHDGRDDRALEVRQRDALPPARTAASGSPDSAAGLDPVGDCRRPGHADSADPDRIDAAGGQRRGRAQRRHQHDGAGAPAARCAARRSRRRVAGADGRLHVGHRGDARRASHRPLCDGPPSCGREPRPGPRGADGGSRSADSDVRCAVAQSAEAAGRDRRQLSGACPAARRGGRVEFSGGVSPYPRALGTVYRYDAEAREQGLSPRRDSRYHQTHSGPVLDAICTPG